MPRTWLYVSEYAMLTSVTNSNPPIDTQQETRLGKPKPVEDQDLKTTLLCLTPVDWVFPLVLSTFFFLSYRRRCQSWFKKIFSGVLWINSKNNC